MDLDRFDLLDPGPDPEGHHKKGSKFFILFKKKYNLLNKCKKQEGRGQGYLVLT